MSEVCKKAFLNDLIHYKSRDADMSEPCSESATKPWWLVRAARVWRVQLGVRTRECERIRRGGTDYRKSMALLKVASTAGLR